MPFKTRLFYKKTLKTLNKELATSLI